MNKIAIIGAGMMGLSLSYHLSKQNIRCDVYESSENTGGLAGFFRYGKVSVDKFYHHFYLHDHDLIDLINELGLKDKLIWEKTPTGIYFGNRIWNMSSPLDLIRFKPLSFTERLKMGLLVFSSQMKKNTNHLEEITAREWIVKSTGEHTYKTMWEPLLKNKFGEFSEDISAEWLCSKFLKRGGSRSKSGDEKLGYIRGGLKLLFETLVEKLSKSGVNIFTSSPVKELVTENGKITGLKLSTDKMLKYDTVISTASTHITADLLGSKFADYTERLKKIKYLANITLVLLLKKSLSDHYWLNVNDPSCPFVAVIEHTKLIDTGEYENLSLAYVPKYLTSSHKFFEMGKEDVLDAYMPWLTKMFPDFSRKEIADFRLCKDTFTQPVITTGYRKLLPPVETPVKSLFLVTMAQIYPEDRQLSNSVKNARQFSEHYGPLLKR